MNVHDSSLEVNSKPVDVKTGLDADYRSAMAATLSEALASTYSLTIKSHVYHWNVAGPLFKPIHELTEDHYNDLFAAADVIAERIRALGHLAPENGKFLSKMSPADSIKDVTVPHDMIEDLIENHEQIARDFRDAASKAGDAGDMVTEDMLTERLTFHEQAIWMLRAIIS
ncbi:MAG: DNA starvation/stationary phase protection protein [Rhizobiaceae bacterium]|nr:DNA starvation/stationary phase protection protein [Rhizobiaceae bacterium]